MIKKFKTPIFLFYINFIIIILSLFSLKVNSETKIIAKSGDTLFKISKQYRVPLKELMYKNSFSDANKIIAGEVVLIPYQDINKNNEHQTYRVIEGDTLYKIAREYNISLKDIMSINNLSNDSYLKLNQIILLPNRVTYKQRISKENIKVASKKVFYHQTSKTEELSNIAYTHKFQLKKLRL